MAKVQKALPGLARFFGIETQGLLRLDVNPTVQPVVEVEDFLSPNPFRLVRTSFTATGQDAEFEVPANKFWRLKWLSVSFAPNVAQGVSFVPYIKKVFQASNFIMPLLPTSLSESGGFQGYQSNRGEFGGYGIPLDKLNAFPGDFVGIRLVALDPNGAFNADLYVQYQELDL